MARRSRRRRDDDQEDEGGGRRGRRSPRGAGGGGAATIFIIAGVGVVLLIAGYFILGGTAEKGMSDAQRRRLQREKERESEKVDEGDTDYVEPDPDEVVARGTTPGAKINSLVGQCSVWSREGKTDLVEKAYKMGINIDAAYKGDFLLYMGKVQTDYCFVKKIEGASERPYFEKALRYYKEAQEAYKQPGAKTTFNQGPAGRVGQMGRLIKNHEQTMKNKGFL